MFRPIKNLITYIQKNASGSAMFGGIAVAEKNNASSEKERENFETDEIENNSEMEKVDVKEVSKSGNSATGSLGRATGLLENYDEEDDYDIEKQIKSIMLKKPLDLPSRQHDHNQNTALEDELDDFRNDPTLQEDALDDICSENSEEHVGEEETEEPFINVTQEIEIFPDSEIIVLSDADLNTSVASDALSEDPLAIDDFTQPLTMRETINPLDSSTNDETSTGTDLLWINVDEIKSSVANAPALTTTTRELNLPQQQHKGSDDEKSPNNDESTPQHQTINISSEDKSTSNSNEDHTEEIRSDGSDSGLGSETSGLQSTLTSIIDTSQVAGSTTATPTKKSAHATLKEFSESAASISPPTPSSLAVKKPMRSNLKRHLEVDEALDSANSLADSMHQKKLKRSINFENVQVYYFPRQQGFGCVPSAGGCTLGMAAHHVAFKTLTLAEHAAELRRAHRLQLQDINPRGSSSDESEESEEDYLSEGSGSDLDTESNGFLQPVSPKQRRALLKAAGVRKIDASEKAECRDIRNSREVCGCTCRDFCDPETCACSQAGIKCQVDRAMFPCGCSRDACGNAVGRVEFNPSRVRTHFIHTIMRLEMENRQQQNPPLGSSISYASSTSSIVTQSTVQPHNYYSMQTQSNYSSGYASPAYTNNQTANYYQQQSSHYGSVATQELNQTSQYQLDSLDSSLFSGSATATPSYGELMPSYGSVSTATASSTYHDINYATVHSSSSMRTQVSTYSYHQQTSANYLTQHLNTNTSNTYSSCAVPSAPPYGTATTTAASPQYHAHSQRSVALETTAPSCATVDGGVAGSSFINLNTPIASSSRISQINDLLQHNRNTTAALVAVAQCPSVSSLCGASSNLPSSLTNNASETASIDTPPIEDAHKSCLAFEELPSPLNPTPIVAVMENDGNSNGNATTKRETPPSTPPDDIASKVEKTCIVVDSAEIAVAVTSAV